MTLTFFYRTGCSLCDAAWEELTTFLGGLPTGEDLSQLAVERIDLVDQPRLELAYGHRIPVIEVENEEICRFFFDESAMRNCLRQRSIAV